MRFVERFEYKYALDYKNYLAFKNKIMAFMQPDDYTLIANKNHYFVRSLYYDTNDYKYFKESEDGQYGRIKCRIRTYNNFKKNTDIISIEIKTKQGHNVKKFSHLIPFENYQYFLKNGYFKQSSKVLDEFTRLLYRDQLEPKLIVEYEREGYHPIDGSDFRLTFDFQVRSGLTDQLFKKNKILTRYHNNDVICEIKCGMKKPAWLEQMIKDYGLKIVGNSKYVQAVKRVYPQLMYGNDIMYQSKHGS